MKWWPFGKTEKRTSSTPPEPSTKDRLLTRNCSRDEFFLLYSKLLQERNPDHRTEFAGESVLRIVDSRGKESTIYLDNLWLKYKESLEDRSELIEKYVRLTQVLGQEDPPLDKQNVVAMIKDSQYLHVGGQETQLLTEHLCGDLWIVYAEDRPETIKTIKPEALLTAGIDKSELRALAVENLKRILPSSEIHGGGPWYLLRAGNDYVASVILLDSMWDEICATGMVAGDVVAAIPTRDVLMFTGSDSNDGIAAIRKRAGEISKSGPHAISDTLIVRRSGTWSVFNAK